MTAASYALASDLGAQEESAPIYNALVSAAELTKDNTNQFEGLLCTTRIFSGVVTGGRYIRMPAPFKNITRVVLAAPNSVNFDVTAVEALGVDDTALAVDETQLTVNDPARTIDREVLSYRKVDRKNLYLTEEQPYNTQVLVYATIGWGKRFDLSAARGFPAQFSASDDRLIFTGTTLPEIGTTYQWDDEVMSVSAYAKSAQGRDVLVMDRALEDTKIAAHARSTGTLYRLDSPAHLKLLEATIARRLIFQYSLPDGGKSWEDEGEESPVGILHGLEPQLLVYDRKRWQ